MDLIYFVPPLENTFFRFNLHHLAARTVCTLCPNYHHSLGHAFVSKLAELFLLSTPLTSCSTIVSKNVGSPSLISFSRVLSADHCFICLSTQIREAML